MKIGLLIISTNKYTIFTQPLIKSADENFMCGSDVVYFLFTDKPTEIETNRNLIVTKVTHKEWPCMTLGRYNIFSENSEIFSEMDYLYYCDVDMLFVSAVNIDILGDRVATQHPYHYNRRGTPETNIASLSYVSPNETMQYFAGGFNGGSRLEYLKMCEKISNNIKVDFSNNIIAIWHDESHMNRYFIDNPPTKILSPSYCYGESMDIPFEKKLIALDKNHIEIRK